MSTFTSFVKSHIQSDGHKSRKRLVILSISLVLLTALIVGVVVLRTQLHRSGDAPTTPTTPPEAVKSICSLTRYPNKCYSSLIPSNSIDPEAIFRFSLTVAIKSLESISTFPEDYAKRSTVQLVKDALGVCGELMNDAIGSLNDVISATSRNDVEDLTTWLSAALTHQDTCLDALGESNATFAGEVENLMRNSTELASNSLAIASKLLAVVDGEFGNRRRRRLLAEFPGWMAAADRRMLQGKGAVVKPDVVVAKDESGDVTTIAAAVARVPKKNKDRYVIKVKAGVYKENVVLDKNCRNVMIIGDGMDKTVITGSKNFVDGTLTFSTATLAVKGKGFIAQDISIRNTAGPGKHQAVAFMSDSDKSVLYRCSFDGFQDTLYTRTNRQFYRECNITGTIDFIFGNAAVVFQNCIIIPRQPLPSQFNTITAQGKIDPNQKTGISIHKCVISGRDNVTAVTYLGRPWKDFSTTIIMETYVSEIVSKLGWISWDPKVIPTNTFYGEYLNTGPGANTSGRVKWKGYKANLTSAKASKYTVKSLIDGTSWLPPTGVTYEPTL